MKSERMTEFVNEIEQNYRVQCNYEKRKIRGEKCCKYISAQDVSRFYI